MTSVHDLKLTPGSTYRVESARTSEETLVSEGTFRGFVGLGNIDALILEVEEGGGQDPVVRLIPAHTVRWLEIVEQAGEEDDGDEAEHIHYG